MPSPHQNLRKIWLGLTLKVLKKSKVAKNQPDQTILHFLDDVSVLQTFVKNVFSILTLNPYHSKFSVDLSEDPISQQIYYNNTL